MISARKIDNSESSNWLSGIFKRKDKIKDDGFISDRILSVHEEVILPDGSRKIRIKREIVRKALDQLMLQGK